MAIRKNTDTVIAKQACDNYKRIKTELGVNVIRMKELIAVAKTDNIATLNETICSLQFIVDRFNNSLNILSGVQRKIIEGLYTADYTLTVNEIANTMKLTPVRIRQIETESLILMQPFLIMEDDKI